MFAGQVKTESNSSSRTSAILKYFCPLVNIIQYMHSFEVNIRICQPKNSDVHQDQAEVNITLEG